MHIVVCVKAVPSSTEVKMDPVTNTIVRDGNAAVINPFDASALEAALQIKDGHAQAAADEDAIEVTALSMGIPATEALLRDCVARGADGGMLLSDRAFAGADTLATAYALTRGIASMRTVPDLIICGKMAVDGDTAQIGPEIAGSFDVPCITDVQEVVSLKGDELVLRHAVEGGEETVRVGLPCVITVSKDLAQLRMPSIAGIRAAASVDIPVLTAEAAGADPARCGLAGSPTQVVRSFVPERTHKALKVCGSASEQAKQLVQIIGEVE